MSEARYGSRPELPERWQWKTLADLGNWVGGGTPSKQRADFWEDGTIPWVSPKDMKTWRLDSTQDLISKAAVDGSSAKLFDANSVALVVRSGILEHTLPVALVPFAATANQDMRVVTPGEDVLAEWLLYALQADAELIRRACSKDGTTVASINVAKLTEWTLAVPPPEEQLRIVATIEQWMEALADGEDRLTAALTRLDQFEAAVVTAAFLGPFSESNGGASVTHDPRREGTDQAGSMTLGQLCESVGGRIQTGPFGSQLHASDYREDGTPLAMPKDLAYGTISRSGIARIGSGDAERLARHAVEPGDILQSRRGDLRRRALVTEKERGWICGTGCFLIRLGDVELAHYVMEHLAEPTTARFIDQRAAGVTMPNLNRRILGDVPLLVPSPDMRRAVLALTSSQLGRASGLRAQVTAARQKLDQLRRAILYTAVAGNLKTQLQANGRTRDRHE